MLELSKQILLKVSFDRKLFKKELLKALKWITPDEKTILKMWCIASFGELYRDVITEVYEQNLRTSF
jgi:hypothetical protein